VVDSNLALLQSPGSFLLALLIVAFGHTAHANAQTKNTLWRVAAGEKTAFLLGSIHFLQKSSYPLNPVIEQAFDSSKRLVLEIDLNAPEKTQAIAFQRGVYRDGTTLRDHISSESYALTEREGKELGLDMQMLAGVKPWLVTFTMLALKLQKLGFDPNYGVDRYFADRAQRAGKITSGLESFDFQIGLVDSLSTREQEAMLLQTIKEIDGLDNVLNQIVQAWTKGDLAALEELLNGSKNDFPDLHEKLIAARNRRWLSQIDKIMEQDGTALIVVGAGHLVGKEGVVELLKQRGYRVEQL
jgi:uncharacterized protein YbaP (TraB family)